MLYSNLDPVIFAVWVLKSDITNGLLKVRLNTSALTVIPKWKEGSAGIGLIRGLENKNIH